MYTNLPVYDNKSPLTLTDEKLKEANKIITKIIESLSFFATRLKESPNMNDVHVHMGLFESYFNTLAPIVQYDSVKTEEYEQRHTELRNAYAEIRRLEQLIGQSVTHTGVSAKLMAYENAMRCFYGALGFQYVSFDNYSSWGITMEFTQELQYEPDGGCTGQKNWIPDFQKHFKPLMNNENWDIYRDTYHAEILDTDRNRQNIKELMTKQFPGCIIQSFHSRRNDYDSYSLRFTVSVSYKDIENMMSQIISKDQRTDEK